MSPLGFLRLGASLYVPASRADLTPILNSHKLPGLRSLIVCTEDAVRTDEIPLALDHLAVALSRIEPTDTLRFVRVRSPQILGSILSMSGVEHLDGFVLPKVTSRNLPDYLAAFPPDSTAQLMLTLETRETFDAVAMRALAQALSADELRARILSLRVGANDLLCLLGLRRPRGATVYDTPIGRTIADLVTAFRPLGFNLTAPLFDDVDDDDTLAREVALDLSMGLFGKTAINPAQVPRIEALYQVPRDDVRVAESVLQGSAPAVFLSGGRLCEPVTQTRWAELTLARAALYGTKD